MSDIQSVITQLRRLYVHMLQGAHITPPDLSRQIAALEGVLADECCHKTRLRDAPCPVGLKCPFIKETANV